MSVEFEHFLTSGASLEDLQRRLRPAGYDDALDRIVPARWLDPEIYSRLTEDLPGAPSLGHLVGSGVLQPLPRQDERFRVPDDIRTERLESHALGSERFAELSSQLLNLYEARGDEVEALYHLVVVNPEDAMERFERLFEQADAQCDLPRCQDLLAAMDDRLARLDAAQSARLDEHTRYLATRRQWLDDWYRSARFIGPEANVAALDRLLSRKAGSLFLWERGGMGKTMHLRWFIARRCVPRPRQIPCARIDFDFIEPRTGAREPWLLLLEMAAQLDPQLPNRPFVELLNQYGYHRKRLELRIAAARQTGGAIPGPRPTPDHVDVDVDDVRERFVAALDGCLCVLLVVDTLEVALLPGDRRRGQTDLEPLLTELARVQRAAPCVRLLLAGRYDLQMKAPQVRKLLADAENVRLRGFGPDEVRRYLLDVRRVDRPDLVEPLLEASRGVPLKLAMTVDDIELEPDIDLDEMSSYAELQYVIQRVLRRIDPALRWLVRFGVIARRLDLGLVEEVIYPYVNDGMRGCLDAELSRDPDDLYPRCKQVPPAAELWASLRTYAGQSSWVNPAPDQDSIQFHPEILAPLRRQLGSGAVVRALHSAAADCFRARAEDNPGRAGRWASESLYHRFQLLGRGAARDWRAWIRYLDEDPNARHALAADLLGSDYLEGDRVQPWLGGRRIVSPDLLLEARYQLALAAVHRAVGCGAAAVSGDWLEARDALDDIQHLQEGRRRPAVTGARLALVGAHLALAEGELEKAEPKVAVALRGRLTPRQSFTLTLAHADALAGAGRDAEALYNGALSHARELPEAARSEARSRVLRQLAAHHRRRDKLAEAEAVLVTLDPADSEVTLERAQVALQGGLPTAAAELAGPVRGIGGLIGARARELVASAKLALGDAEGALREVEALHEAKQLPGQRLELRGEAHGQQLRMSDAIGELQKAASRYASMPEPAGVCRASTKAAALALRGGDIVTTRSALAQARRSGPSPGSEESTEIALLEAELAKVDGMLDTAEELLDTAQWNAEVHRAPPHVIARIAMTRLGLLDPGLAKHELQSLIAVLGEVTPPRARLALLGPLERAPAIEAPWHLRVTLGRVVPSPETNPSAFEGVTAPDLARLRLFDAQLRRVIGDRVAVDRIASALEDLVPLGVGFGLGAVAVRAGASALARMLEQRASEHAGAERSLPAAAIRVQGVISRADGGELSEADRAELKYALEVLEGRGEDGRVWAAQACEALARDALARGQGPAAWAARAAAIYAELGNVAAHKRALALVGGTPDVDAEPDWVDARIEFDTAACTLRLVRSDVDRAVTFGSSTTAEALTAALGEVSTEAATWVPLARLLRDKPKAFVRLRGSPAGRAVRLAAEPQLLQALPWELATGLRAPLLRRMPTPTPPDAEVQRALNALVQPSTILVDGVIGPETGTSLEAFQASQGLAVTGKPDPETMRALLTELAGGQPPRVLVLRPDERAAGLARRDVVLTGATPEEAYDEAGYRVRVESVLDADELAELIGKHPAAIVHLCCSLIDAQGTPALNLMPAALKSRGAVLYASALDTLLDAHSMRPLVVIDVPCPPSSREAVLQLLLRNAFAAELIAASQRCSVLATGLVAPAAQRRFYVTLMGALERPLAQLGAELRTAVPGDWPSAVFGRDPQWLAPVRR